MTTLKNNPHVVVFTTNKEAGPWEVYTTRDSAIFLDEKSAQRFIDINGLNATSAKTFKIAPAAEYIEILDEPVWSMDIDWNDNGVWTRQLDGLDVSPYESCYRSRLDYILLSDLREVETEALAEHVNQ